MVGTVTLYETLLTEIKRCNDIDEPVYLTKLFEDLFESRYQIRRHIDNLIDFGMIEGKYGVTHFDTTQNEYGTTVAGYAGYRYHITDIGNRELSRLLLK